MMKQEDGRFGSADRATHEQSPQAVSAVPVGIPSAQVFARASEIAQARFPNGTNATNLASILREAISEVRGPKSHSRRSSVQQRPHRHNVLELLTDEEQRHARLICAGVAARYSPGRPPCTDKGFVCYRCQDLAAQAIEACRAETGTGSVHESAVGNADAPNPNPETHCDQG